MVWEDGGREGPLLPDCPGPVMVGWTAGRAWLESARPEVVVVLDLCLWIDCAQHSDANSSPIAELLPAVRGLKVELVSD